MDSPLTDHDRAVIASALATALRREAARQRDRAAALRADLRRQWAKRRR